jgi:hypothetical protein
MVKRFIVFYVMSALFFPASAVLGLNVQPSPLPPGREFALPSPTVSPETVDFGELRPGEEAKGAFFMNKTASVNPEWFAEAPEGWQMATEYSLSGLVGEAPAPLSITLRFQKIFSRYDKKYAALLLRMETGGRSVSLSRDVPLGELRERLQFNYVGGSQGVSFTARLSELAATPMLELDMFRVDLGKIRVGETVSQRVHLTNRGKTPLKWKVRVAGANDEPGQERYISFQRVISEFPAALSGQTQEGLDFSGNWMKKGGYPEGAGEQSSMRYRFTGTGATLYFWRSPKSGPFSVFLDGQFVDVIDGFAENGERSEVLIAENQPDGPHLLTAVCGDGPVTFEGVSVFGKTSGKGPRGWVTVFPDSGFTTRETDYINISINTRGLLPGIYGDRLLFSSNGGAAELQFSLEVAGDTHTRLLDVHRYLAGSDCLLTSTPHAETALIKARGYSYAGLPFRLFTPGTPGTIEFYRWFNSGSGDHYYSYKPDAGKGLPGYTFEGAIGNIGTSKLTGTKELYRWVNRKTRHHFFTTDQSGEGMAKKGFQYDGISGFVR